MFVLSLTRVLCTVLYTDPSTMGQPSAPGEQWQISVRQDVRDHLIKKM